MFHVGGQDTDDHDMGWTLDALRFTNRDTGLFDSSDFLVY